MTTPRRGTVLVADDDRSVRESVAEILESDGYRVVEATDGEEALERLHSGEVDAVLLDIKMPRRDGLSVLDVMSPPPPPPSVVLVTAYDVEPEVKRRLGGRVIRILRKPVPPMLLLDVVDDAMRAAGTADGA